MVAIIIIYIFNSRLCTDPLPELTVRYGAGNTTQPILIRDVECEGNETSISECNHPEVNDVGFCTHQADVGVFVKVCDTFFHSCENLLHIMNIHTC